MNALCCAVYAQDEEKFISLGRFEQQQQHKHAHKHTKGTFQVLIPISETSILLETKERIKIAKQLKRGYQTGRNEAKSEKDCGRACRKLKWGNYHTVFIQNGWKIERLAECARCRFNDVTPNRYRFIFWRPNQRRFSSFSIALTKWFQSNAKNVNKQHSVYETHSTQPKRQRLIMPFLNFSGLLMNAAALIQWTSLTDKNILFQGNFRYTILIQKYVQMVIKRKSTTNFSHTYPTQYTALTTLVNLKLLPSNDPIRSDIILF